MLLPREHADREQNLDGEPSLRRREPAMPRRSIHRLDTPPATFAKFVADDTAKWAKVIREANIKPQ
jgi:hypothetical protein